MPEWAFLTTLRTKSYSLSSRLCTNFLTVLYVYIFTHDFFTGHVLAKIMLLVFLALNCLAVQ